MDHICPSHNQPCSRVPLHVRCDDCPRRGPGSIARPLQPTATQVCPNKDAECGPSSKGWCPACPLRKPRMRYEHEGEPRSETLSQKMERIHRGDPGWPWPKASDVFIDGTRTVEDEAVRIEPMYVGGKVVAMAVVDPSLPPDHLSMSNVSVGQVTFSDSKEYPFASMGVTCNYEGNPGLLKGNVVIHGKTFNVDNIQKLAAIVEAYDAIKVLMAHPDQDGVLARIRDAIQVEEAQ